MFPGESMPAGRAPREVENFNLAYLLQIGDCVEMRGEVDYELAVAVAATSHP